MDKGPQFSFPQASGSSLLIVFATLCLSVFAFFLLTGARGEGRFSTDRAQSVSAYYTADAQAEGILARIRAGELPEGVTRDGDICSFSCPIGTTQMLMVKVRFSGADYTVLRWQTVSLEDWAAEQKPISS